MSRALSLRALAVAGALALMPVAISAQGVLVTHCKDGTTTASVGKGACADHGGVVLAGRSKPRKHSASKAKHAKSSKASKGGKATKHKKPGTKTTKKVSSAPAPAAPRTP